MSKLTLPKKAEVIDSGKRADENNPVPGVGSGNADALARRNAIADAADDIRKDEMVEVGDELHLQTDTPPDDLQVSEEPKKFKLKVGGKDVEMTESEVIARAQKVENADEYLRSASQSVKTAATLALSSDEQEPEETDFRALAKALQMGTEEEAEQALRKLTERAKPSKTQDVSQLVRSELTLRDEKAKFDEDFKDVLTDPYLAKLVTEKDKEFFEADPNLPYNQRWRKAGEEVRTWAKGFKGVSSLDKAARKASVAPVPTAAGRQQVVEEDDAEDSPESVIANMAKARKQERPVKH